MGVLKNTKNISVEILFLSCGNGEKRDEREWKEYMFIRLKVKRKKRIAPEKEFVGENYIKLYINIYLREIQRQRRQDSEGYRCERESRRM